MQLKYPLPTYNYQTRSREGREIRIINYCSILKIGKGDRNRFSARYPREVAAPHPPSTDQLNSPPPLTHAATPQPRIYTTVMDLFLFNILLLVWIVVDLMINESVD